MYTAQDAWMSNYREFARWNEKNKAILASSNSIVIRMQDTNVKIQNCVNDYCVPQLFQIGMCRACEDSTYVKWLGKNYIYKQRLFAGWHEDVVDE